MTEEKEIGRILHYFSKIGVAIVELKAPLTVGDKIRIKGISTDFKQTVESMQIEHQNIQTAGSGQSIGLKVSDRVRESDAVYLTT